MNSAIPLHIIDCRTLSAEHRALLRPGEAVVDEAGCEHELPRFFYAVESWAQAHEIRLSPSFKLAELMTVDCREADLLWRTFPHYVPCAIALLAAFLEAFRAKVDAPVFVAANGGYRSPAHQFSGAKNPHGWGAAVDIYRVGDTYLHDPKSLAKYARVAESLGGGFFVKPGSAGLFEPCDHLHVDLGYVVVRPRLHSETAAR